VVLRRYPMSSTKRCTKCGEVKSLDAFHRNRRGALGRQSRCRACLREYYAANRDRFRERNRAWYEANRDRKREYQRAWYEANRDRVLEYSREYGRAWRAANRDRQRERNRAWYEANRDYRREYRRAWHEANRDRIREYNRAWSEANRDRKREYNRAWYEANREHRREYRREHYDANRDRYYEYAHRRRARKRSTTVEELAPADIYAWWEELGAYTCFWCDLPFDEGDSIHVDHVWPLSRGGHHAVRNLVPACKRCNLAKHSSLPHEFEERAYEEWLASTSE
jgi:5-methylcytosine-specific restriction endonuclease McrA